MGDLFSKEKLNGIKQHNPSQRLLEKDSQP
jgi:hypothetical protein